MAAPDSDDDTSSRQSAEHRRKLRFLLDLAVKLAATSMVTAGLGFAYWAIAARMFPADDVGQSSTAVSVTNLLAPLTVFGLGTLMVIALPAMRSGRATLLSTVAAVVGLAATVVSLLCALLLPDRFLGLAGIGHDPVVTALFVGLAATSAVGVLLDQSLLAVAGGGIQLTRNLILAVAKLVLLVAFVLAMARFGGSLLIVGSWFLANVISIAVVVAVLIRRHRVTLRQLVPRPAMLRGMHLEAAQHHALNIALQAPYFLMPVVANSILGSEKAAYLFASWSVAGFVFFLPISLAMALFASGARDTRTFLKEFRFTVRIALLISAAANVLLALFGGLVLRIFGTAYEENGRLVLIVLALGGLGLIIKDHHFTLARVTGTQGREAVLMTILGVGEILGAVIGAHRGGILGLALGWLAAIGVEVLVCGPLVWRAYRGKVDVPVHTHIGDPLDGVAG